jgi:hypothetical protein
MGVLTTERDTGPIGRANAEDPSESDKDESVGVNFGPGSEAGPLPSRLRRRFSKRTATTSTKASTAIRPRSSQRGNSTLGVLITVGAARTATLALARAIVSFASRTETVRV